MNDFGREFDGALFFGVDEGQQCFGEARQVPLGDCGLVRVGVAALPINRAENGPRIILIHKGAGAEVDRLS